MKLARLWKRKKRENIRNHFPKGVVEVAMKNIDQYISEKIQDMVVAMEDEYDLVCCQSNGAIFDDPEILIMVIRYPEWPLT